MQNELSDKNSIMNSFQIRAKMSFAKDKNMPTSGVNTVIRSWSYPHNLLSQICLYTHTHTKSHAGQVWIAIALIIIWTFDHPVLSVTSPLVNAVHHYHIWDRLPREFLLKSCL